ncbi:hypothetical protein ACXWO6_10680, partial [Streptococcus pyogenes]
FRGETPGIFIVLSGFATSDLSVDFCDARQGGGAYGKTPATQKGPPEGEPGDYIWALITNA